MELIWNRFRPPTARSSTELSLLLRVEDLSDKLDGVAWRSKASLNMLLDLRRTILRFDMVDALAKNIGGDMFTVFTLRISLYSKLTLSACGKCSQ